MLDIAEKIVAQQTGDFDPEEFNDRYEDALRAMIDEKRKGKPVKSAKPKEADDTNVIDLMAALKKSLDGKGGEPFVTGDAGQAEEGGKYQPPQGAGSMSKTPSPKPSPPACLPRRSTSASIRAPVDRQASNRNVTSRTPRLRATTAAPAFPAARTRT